MCMNHDSLMHPCVYLPLTSKDGTKDEKQYINDFRIYVRAFPKQTSTINRDSSWGQENYFAQQPTKPTPTPTDNSASKN
jgi:hypothetical protein